MTSRELERSRSRPQYTITAKTAGDTNSVTKEHLQDMSPRVSNGHVSDVR